MFLSLLFRNRTCIKHDHKSSGKTAKQCRWYYIAKSIRCFSPQSIQEIKLSFSKRLPLLKTDPPHISSRTNLSYLTTPYSFTMQLAAHPVFLHESTCPPCILSRSNLPTPYSFPKQPAHPVFLSEATSPAHPAVYLQQRD